METFERGVKVWERWGLEDFEWGLDVYSPSFKCFKTLDVLFGIVCAETDLLSPNFLFLVHSNVRYILQVQS